MEDGQREVRCPGCGHAFPAARSGRWRLAECPGCGGWFAVPADPPSVSPSEFLRGQLASGGRGADGGGADSCGA